MFADAKLRQLLIPRGNRVEVYDLDTIKSIGTISPANGVHGAIVDPEAGHGFLNDHSDDRIPPLFALSARCIGGAEFQETSAIDARRRIASFFRRHLASAD